MYVRNTQEWFTKKLNGFELETLFGWLDSEHKPILEGLNQLVEEFCLKNDTYGEKAAQREEQKQRELQAAKDDSSSGMSEEIN